MGVGRGTRRAVTLFLAAFFVAGVFGIEFWPLTGWRLFSHLRRAEVTSWQAVVVTPSGTEEPLPFGEIARFRGTVHVLKRFDGLDPRTQNAVCRTWESAVRDLRGDGFQIRIYRVNVTRSIDRRQDPGAYRRSLRFVCHDGVAERREPA